MPSPKPQRPKPVINYDRITFQNMLYDLIDLFVDHDLSELAVMDILANAIQALREGWE